ncbi:MAG: hypothetical protein LBB84_09955 [Tannerellaceae bacterium]|jgi:hypothetical protein|nr:hypothetical protein [Tannerellaceae bacterium]
MTSVRDDVKAAYRQRETLLHGASRFAEDEYSMQIHFPTRWLQAMEIFCLAGMKENYRADVTFVEY